MTAHAMLDEIVGKLGYKHARGYVDDTVERGPRDMVWTDLKEKCGVTAAFFSGAVPVVAFVAAETRDDAMRAHRRLWNYGRVPILLVTTSDEVLALSCNTAQAPGRPDAALLAEAHRGQELSEVLADFTRFSVESGRLVRSRSKQLQTQDRVDHLLLRNLRVVRSRLLSAGVEDDEIEPLLGRSIFVRYLEDRRILEPANLRELGQPESLEVALRGGWAALSSLFAAMSDHFHGDVFGRDVLRRRLPDAALQVLYDFFEGVDLETGGVPLWRYDFAIIPPELISSIYEQLLAPQQKSDAAYYTPRRVVDLVLDELLPISIGPSIPTVLDPACGSGIFLTETFRRLVYRRKSQSQLTPSYAELSELLVKSVFGVDKNPDAIGVTAFGLYLALLEHVDPRTIWREVRLPDLVGTNLVVADFFEQHALSGRTFDLIAGNPPWQSSLTAAAAKYVGARGIEVPDRQIAVPFIWRASEMLVRGGAIGLVLPAKTLLHNRGPSADRFRLEFFGKLDVQTIVDLSPLRKQLFGAVSPAAIAIFGSTRVPHPDQLLHVSPRRTPISEIVDGIVVPQQNIQAILRSRASTDPAIWKPLLWGGPADLDLVSRLRRAFEPLVARARSKGWAAGAGFQVVKNGDENDASHLHDLPHLATRALGAMDFPRAEALGAPVSAPSMHRPRDRAIYLAPHVLMRKGFSAAPMAAFVPYNASFTDGLFALAGPEDDRALLRAVAVLLNSSVARYWYFMTSSSWGVEREQLHQREWLSLPLPPLDARAVTMLNDFADSLGRGLLPASIDVFIERDLYKLKGDERQLITDALTVKLSEMQEGPTAGAYEPANLDALEAYATALRRYMDDLELGEWSVDVSETSHGFARVTCTHIETARARDELGRFVVDNLLLANRSESESPPASATIVEPQAVILDHARVHVIKADRRANWIVSAAATDASDIFDALLSREHLPAGVDLV